VDDIKMNLEKQSGMDWIHLAEGDGPVAGSCEHGDEPSGFIEFWEIIE
jgi:hypothetical protein